MATGGVFGYHETDSEDEMPPGWEERTTDDGKVYYVNHLDQSTQWIHPRTGKQKELVGELPGDWEKTVVSGRSGFRHLKTGETTFTDPRLVNAVEVRGDPHGPSGFRHRFDGSSTAMQVLHGVDLSGKYILITGATSGIGFETAKTLAIHNATVVMVARDTSKAQKAIAKIQDRKPSAKFHLLHCDLTSLKSVRRCAEEYKSKGWPLHVAILNAGVYGLPYGRTDDGFETTFQVNHLAQFYLTQLLLPQLVSSAPSRVVFVSSESHRFAGRYNLLSSPVTPGTLTESFLSPTSSSDHWYQSAYNVSKLANIWLAMALHRQISAKKVTVNVLHPGNLINTGLFRSTCLAKVLAVLIQPFAKTLVRW